MYVSATDQRMAIAAPATPTVAKLRALTASRRPSHGSLPSAAALRPISRTCSRASRPHAEPKNTAADVAIESPASAPGRSAPR